MNWQNWPKIDQVWAWLSRGHPESGIPLKVRSWALVCWSTAISKSSFTKNQGEPPPLLGIMLSNSSHYETRLKLNSSLSNRKSRHFSFFLNTLLNQSPTPINCKVKNACSQHIIIRYHTIKVASTRVVVGSHGHSQQHIIEIRECFKLFFFPNL